MPDMIFKTKITTTLGTFEFEGSQEFIEKQVEKVIEVSKSSSSISKLSSMDLKSHSASKNASSRKSALEQPKMLPNLITNREKIDDIRNYYTSKMPETHIETFATLALWLRNNSELAEVSIDEMWTTYKILGIKPPKVLIQVFRDGKSKKAYFETGSQSSKYYLTPLGETFVEHDLPRNKGVGAEK